MKTREFRIKVVLLAVVLLAMVLGFSSLLFHHAPDVFNDPKEDMSFGWYVPIFSLYVLWRERAMILSSLGSASWQGALATIPFLFFGFLGVRGIQIRFEILAFVGLLITIPWAFFGRECAKRLVFPAGFLLFCIPLASFLDIITVHLRLFATGAAAGILQAVGAGIVRTGTMLTASDGSFAIDVAAPCSGLRSIFALMAITAAYAYFNQPNWWRRALLFACSVPLAVFGNIMRILTICLVGTLASRDFATGFYHDYSGYVVFGAALALMVGCGGLITKLADAARGESQETDAAVAKAKTAPERLWVAVGLSLVTIGVMISLALTPETLITEPPKVILGEIEGFTSEEIAVSSAELEVLPDDTQFVKRLYKSEEGDWYAVSVVIGGTSKNSIHRPELCLPSQGFLMTEPHTVSINDWQWRIIKLDGNGMRPSLGFAYTFFNQAGFRTSSHIERIFRDVWDRSMFNRIDRWVMVTLNTSCVNDLDIISFLVNVQEVLK